MLYLSLFTHILIDAFKVGGREREGEREREREREKEEGGGEGDGEEGEKREGERMINHRVLHGLKSLTAA